LSRRFRLLSTAYLWAILVG